MNTSASTEKLPLVYSCSGCSTAAQMANSFAVQMDLQGKAEMSCIAGVGGDVASLVKTAKSDRVIIALDGCPLACARACLARQGVQPSVHFELSDYNIKKLKHQTFDQEQAREVYEKICLQLKDLGIIEKGTHYEK